MSEAFRARCAAFWLRTLFRVGRHAPVVLRAFRPLVVFGVPVVSKKVRTNTRLNHSRLSPSPGVPGEGDRRFARGVVGSFYDFVIEIAASANASPADLRQQIVAIEGREAYLGLREQKCGAVLVTAHMGSFEVGLAALTEVEPVVHVVFKRDVHDGFEQLRRPLRERLGVQEAAIDDGWPTLVELRDALARDEVVVMQADRAMLGQKSAGVKIGSGTLRIPVGPVTLARINGSPIVPVFAVRQSRGRFRVFIEPAINPEAPDAIEQVGRAIERFVLRYPTQWLVLDAAFVEDANSGIG